MKAAEQDQIVDARHNLAVPVVALVCIALAIVLRYLIPAICVIFLFVTPLSAYEPAYTPAKPPVMLPPPKAAPAVVVFVRPLTLREISLARRAAWHADMAVRLQERQSRSIFGYGVFLRLDVVGGCCK